jgi:hypothetical protein
VGGISDFLSDAVDAIGDAVTSVVEGIGDAVTEVVRFTEFAIDSAGEAFEEVGKWTAEAVDAAGDAFEDLGDALGEVADAIGMGKDGWFTNFVQDYIPGGGAFTAIFHSAAGHNDYAEYAAMRGLSTLIQAGAAVAGTLLAGPAGGALLRAGLAIGMGALAGGISNLWESGMKEYLRASVKDKIADFSWENLARDIGIGAGAAALGSGLGAAGKKAGGFFKKAGGSAASTAAKTGPVAAIKRGASKAGGWLKKKWDWVKKKREFTTVAGGMKVQRVEGALKGAGKEAVGLGESAEREELVRQNRQKERLRQIAIGMTLVLVLVGVLSECARDRTPTDPIAAPGGNGQLSPSDKGEYELIPSGDKRTPVVAPTDTTSTTLSTATTQGGGTATTTTLAATTTTTMPPIATVQERFVCYAEPYLYVLFDTTPVAVTGTDAVMVLNADPVGQGEPDTVAVEDGGALYFAVYGVEPGWTISVVSLVVDGVEYTTDFGFYQTPTNEEAGC